MTNIPLAITSYRVQLHQSFTFKRCPNSDAGLPPPWLRICTSIPRKVAIAIRYRVDHYINPETILQHELEKRQHLAEGKTHGQIRILCLTTPDIHPPMKAVDVAGRGALSEYYDHFWYQLYHDEHCESRLVAKRWSAQSIEKVLRCNSVSKRVYWRIPSVVSGAMLW